jgi:2-polyprenyl-3-methyl-5-hydroxy-6-metoxy-1,4-benzoquinol methylase
MPEPKPSPTLPTPDLTRAQAYTTARSDVASMVPEQALNILDLGCSNGALGRSLKHGRPERRLWGVEYDAGFAASAAAVLDHVHCADLNQLDWDTVFGEQRFDCMIFADVLEHLVDPPQCLRQARRFLAPGATVVVSLPNIRHLSAFVSIFLRGQFPRRDRGLFDRTHLRWFTIRDAHQLLIDAGFKVQDSEQAMRWGDQGGGRWNRLLNRLPRSIRRFAPVRELLTYQLCLRATPEP